MVREGVYCIQIIVITVYGDSERVVNGESALYLGVVTIVYGESGSILYFGLVSVLCV